MRTILLYLFTVFLYTTYVLSAPISQKVNPADVVAAAERHSQLSKRELPMLDIIIKEEPDDEGAWFWKRSKRDFLPAQAVKPAVKKQQQQPRRAGGGQMQKRALPPVKRGMKRKYTVVLIMYSVQADIDQLLQQTE